VELTQVTRATTTTTAVAGPELIKARSFLRLIVVGRTTTTGSGGPFRFVARDDAVVVVEAVGPVIVVISVACVGIGRVAVAGVVVLGTTQVVD
jgi:hypothetical protein